MFHGQSMEIPWTIQGHLWTNSRKSMEIHGKSRTGDACEAAAEQDGADPGFAGCLRLKATEILM